MTATVASGVDFAEAIARVLAGPFVWRTMMPPQGGPELDAVCMVESTTQVTDQAFSVTAEEGVNRGRAAHSCRARRDSLSLRVRDRLSLTEVPEGPEFVGSSADLTNRRLTSGTEEAQVGQLADPGKLGVGSEEGAHLVGTPGVYRGGTPSSSVNTSDATVSVELPETLDVIQGFDATVSVRATDGKGVQGLHPPAVADLRGVAQVTVPGVSAAVDALNVGSPVPAACSAVPERVHPPALTLPDRPGAVVAQTETTAADGGCTRGEVHAGYVPGGAVPAEYTGPERGKQDELATAARARFADVLARGGVPSIRTLRAEYGIGQARAQRVQVALRRVPAAA